MSALTGPTTSLGRALLVPRAFFVRDRRIEMSYRAGLLLRLASAVATVGMFFFLSRTFDAAAPGLTAVGGELLRVRPARDHRPGVPQSQSIGGFGGALRESQTTGTLELMLLGPSRLATLLLLVDPVAAGIGRPRRGRRISCSASLLGVDISRTDVPAALLGLVLMIVGFTGMGLLAGAVVLVIKRGNPLGWALRGASVVLGGTLYPVEVLPAALQASAPCCPMTHALPGPARRDPPGPGRSPSSPGR